MKNRKLTKAEIYADHGIETKKINSTLYLVSPIGLVRPPLVNGNAKIGKGVFHFSTLPGTGLYDVTVCGREWNVQGTCICDCAGCYAKSGNYRYQSVKNALGMRTILARHYLSWLDKAIRAQIVADHIETVRIHAAGDFFSLPYAFTWEVIARDFPTVVFWTYTKVREYEGIFGAFENANIVKSILPDGSLNFGHIDHIEKEYKKLTAAGETVHICLCGTDKDLPKDKQQHCNGCKGCSCNEYVLFIEHSTDYVAEKEKNWEDFKNWVRQLVQEKESMKKAV